MRWSHRVCTLVACAAVVALPERNALGAQRDDRFIVGDIRIEGLQRIAEGTVFNYLPVDIGEPLDARRMAEAMRALYATGFFRDVELRRDGGTLIVAVHERPSIESFEIRGNKELKTEDLRKSLRSVGLATGKTFDRSVLDEVTRSLTEQYFAHGKYAVRVDTRVEELPGNKVKIEVEIAEGKRARIRQINIAGNAAFSDADLLAQFELKTPNWLSWYAQDDRYAREALTGDLEKLRSWYMDRGYANFSVASTQVAIAPEKEDIFVTINVSEGEIFRVGDVKIAGNRVLADSELERLLFVHPGDIYSRKYITATAEAMKARLARDGYAFATVDPVPQADPATGSIALSFVIDPHNRVYVRRVSFNGASSVNDEVFRRELRQLEGTCLSNAAVERSRQRIQRLPFIEKVESDTTPVPGAPDLVDVEFDIEEGLPGQFGAGVGYSRERSLSVTGNFVHSNFLGTGNRVALDVDIGHYGNSLSFSHTDPYTNVDGVQRTVGLRYQDTKQFTSATSAFDTRSFAGSIGYEIPVSETAWLTTGLTAQHMEQSLLDDGRSSLEAIDWVSSNGDPTLPCRADSLGPCTPSPLFDAYQTQFDTYEASVGWLYDSRDRLIFANRGMQHRLTLSYALPVSDVQYWAASYEYLQFVPLNRWFTLMLHLDTAYGSALGGTTSFPPHRQFYAGGTSSVRGFEAGSLGPRDSIGNAYGGNIKAVAQTELLLPMPEKWRYSARFSLFYDIGNVFSDQNIAFLGPPTSDGSPREHVDYGFRFDDLRQSAGVALQWLSPLGTFRLSYGIALNARSGSATRYGDETREFDFSIGKAF